jgi:branched-chain amino acid transport system permease protein
VKRSASRYTAGIVTIVILVAAGFSGGYYEDALTLLFINAILVVSFRFIALTGELSFCHIALMGVGAYTTGLVTTRLGWPFWISLPLAGAISGLVALILSYALFRLKAFYFAICSFAAAEAIRLSWQRFEFFGGYDGIYNLPYPSVLGIDFHNLTAYYYLTLFLALLCLLIMYRLENSDIGMTIKSVAARDFLAQSVGIDIWRYKTFAFVTGSLFAGVAGVLYAHRTAWIDPGQFAFTLNLYVLIWALFGGLATFAGPLVGLVSLTLVDEVIHNIGDLDQWLPLVYGCVIIATLRFLPHGFVDVFTRITWLIGHIFSRFGKKRVSF